VKFLVDREGQAVARYKPGYDPLDFEADVSGIITHCRIAGRIVPAANSPAMRHHMVSRHFVLQLAPAHSMCSTHSFFPLRPLEAVQYTTLPVVL
jgi:hypothetical protein